MAFSFSPHVRTYLSAKRRGSRPVLDGDGHAQRGDVLRTNCGGGGNCAFVKFAGFQEADKRKRVGVEKAEADQWLGCVKLQKTRVTMAPITL